LSRPPQPVRDRRIRMPQANARKYELIRFSVKGLLTVSVNC
jgi:hypothetical protein